MSDRELLEKAAKAVGWLRMGECDDGTLILLDHGPWNPLSDDGDALRLAVKMKILRCHMDLFHTFYEEEIYSNGTLDAIPETLRAAATRRAIVRAAASLAKEVDQQ